MPLRACMRTQLASPAESATTIILRRLCISPAEARTPGRLDHICNKFCNLEGRVIIGDQILNNTSKSHWQLWMLFIE